MKTVPTIDAFTTILFDGKKIREKVKAIPSATPGLIVIPAFVAFGTFHNRQGQVIHKRSGALIATFPTKTKALKVAAELGKCGLDFTRGYSWFKKAAWNTPEYKKARQIVREAYL